MPAVARPLELNDNEGTFQPVDGEDVLGKIRGFEFSSWNFIGHDPQEVSPLWPGSWRRTSMRPSATTD